MLRSTTNSPAMRDQVSPIFPSPRSSSSIMGSPYAAQSAAQPSRTKWFNFRPVQAYEDPMRDVRVSHDLQHQELEEAEEVTEKSDLDEAAEDRNMPLAFNSARHTDMLYDAGATEFAYSWRMRERMKTVSVALVICLNVGVDPPDVTKTQPCARMEAWIDPATLNPQRAIEAIGNNLQKQYERWQPKARYRQSLDPPLEEVRRLATGLRRNARDERVLFHYNGHGVPKPTANGEIWVFNRNYTQYIPLSLYDLQAWMGSPSIFVYDCSNAGTIVRTFEQFAEQHEREYYEQVNSQGISSADLPPPISLKNCIQLAACSANQILPMNPELPADLFTACLTTPIKMALRWFVMQKHGKLAPDLTVEILDKIPGQFGDRRTMLGELNWIFTAITDTIAWNTLPRDLFQKLFRQDLLVASLFRNFLLAERIMRSYDCNPISQPTLPSTAQHNMWKAWDLAVDMSLSQLKGILDRGESYKSTSFFEEQLTAFEVWLRFGDEQRSPPEQLPIVLQVLLSQAHRLRALDLLGRFLDIGPWAVNLALSVGIFPYVLKLLQSSARELRPLLVSIWAKILSVDQTCQADLIRESSHKYFLSVLQDECMMPIHRTWAAFILATIVNKFQQGQQEAEQGNLINICLEHLDDPDPILRQWLVIALGRVWENFEKARWRGTRDNAHEKLYEMLKDEVPEVRASAVFALGTFLNACNDRCEMANNMDHSVTLHLLKTCMVDASPIVRRELVVALKYVVSTFEANFVSVCRSALEEEQQQQGLTGADSGQAIRRISSRDGLGLVPSISSSALDRIGLHGIPSQTTLLRASTATFLSGSSLSIVGFYQRVWMALQQLAIDPDDIVEKMAETIILFLTVKARERMRTDGLGLNRSSILIENNANASTNTVSVPSSPATKPSFMVGGASPPGGLANLNASAIEEEDERISEGTAAENATGTRRKRQTRPQSHNPSPTVTQMSTEEMKLPEMSTGFIAWSTRYFTRTLMRNEPVGPDEDLESPNHWMKEWLYNRNLEVRSEADNQRELLKMRLCRIDHPVLSFRTGFIPSLVAFHPYNNQVAVGSSRQILLQHLDTCNELCSIEVKSKRNKTIASRNQLTSLNYLNAQEHALLLVGSDDGFLRVYKDREDANSPMIDVITSWNALREHTPITTVSRKNQNFGMKVAWDQKSRTIAVGGNCKIVRLWDAVKEQKVYDLQTGFEGNPLTSLSFSPLNPSLLAAGFVDGSVLIYDVRKSDSGRTIEFRDHQKPVLDCLLQDSGGYSGHLVSGSADGDIKVFDPRKKTNVIKHVSVGQPISALSIHKRAYAAAAWTTNQATIAVHTLLGNGAQLNSIRIFSEGSGSLLSARRGAPLPVGSLAFHPHLLQLAIGPTDGTITIYNARKTV